MADLDPKLRELDGIQPPDLWPSIDGGQPPRRTPPLGWHRVTAAAVALLVGASGVGVAGIAFVASRHRLIDRPPPGASFPPGGSPLSVSGAIDHGRLRCTADFPSSVLVPGTRTGVRFTVTNVSSRAVDIKQGVNGDAGWMIIRASGREIADTSHMHDGIFGPGSMPKRLPPGETADITTWDAPVVWPGTLTVTPLCEGTPLPQVRLQVYVPGRGPTSQDAVARAVAAAGEPFQDCRPTEDQVWVTGTIHHGTGLDFPARCGALVLQNPGFSVVIVAIVSPPAAPSVDLQALADQMGATPSLGVRGSLAVSWWRFVVTRDRVSKVSQFSVAQRCEGSAYQAGGGVLSCRFPTGH